MSEDFQCPTCGRIREDWGNDSTKHMAIHKTKDKQRKDSEDRLSDYRKWRWKFGNGCYVNDIDQLEWRMVEGETTPVALLEMTRVDGSIPVPPTYLDSILKRFKERDGQRKIMLRVCDLLGVDVYIVCYRWDLTEFWVYNLSNGSKWIKLSKEKYEQCIKNMKSKFTSKCKNKEKLNEARKKSN